MRSVLQRNLELIFHAAFWGVYISFNIYHITSYQVSPQINWTKVLISTSSNVIYALVISYLNYFYFVPILIRKQIGKFIVGFLVSFT
ncbi:MAG TPA: hypothetical protein VKQ08_01805, partial [Cyclobacteriaceae bacterium]|nr:hypothetical protein [Cyclobacteriaceae bacterium]